MNTPDVAEVPTEAAHACDRCEATFGSRNALFRHLRAEHPETAGVGVDDDASSSSAPKVRKTNIARAFDELARGPSPLGAANVGARVHASQPSRRHKREADMTKEEVRALNERRRARAERRKASAPLANMTNNVEAELWIGGLVDRAASLRGFKELLYKAMPRGTRIPIPQVKHVKRRGYKVKGEWVGFGFIVCRDAEEAKELREHMDGTTVTLSDGSTCVLKVSPATYKRATPAREEETVTNTSETSKPRVLAPGEHPGSRDIFMAWTNAHLERRAAARDVSVDELVAAAVRDEIPYVALSGKTVNKRLTRALRDELIRTKWLLHPQRRTVKSDSYLILKRQISERDPYEALKLACEALMVSIDATFPYDTLAVTKNFISSPHIDKDDVSYQFSMSFGEFSDGGELCVEARDGSSRWMIDTREKMAKFDGRSVHWVRGYGGGDRYSVVWFVNRDSNATEQTFDVDLSFTDPHTSVDDGRGNQTSCCVVQ